MAEVRSSARRRVILTIPLYIDNELYEALYLLSIKLNKSISKVVEEIVVDHDLTVPINAESVEVLLLRHPMIKQAVEMLRSEPDDCAIAVGSSRVSSS
ncbi:MAG: hypothetical protein ACK4FV_06950 [Candidatus Nitrosocaldus sp.]